MKRSDVLLHTFVIILGIFVGVMMLSSQAAGEGRREDMSESVFSGDEIYGYLKDIVVFGNRRTGSTELENAAHYIAGQLKVFGLQDVNLQPASYEGWFPTEWNLELLSEDG